MVWPTLVSQRHDGIDFRCTPGRDITGKRGHNRQNHNHAEKICADLRAICANLNLVCANLRAIFADAVENAEGLSA